MALSALYDQHNSNDKMINYLLEERKSVYVKIYLKDSLKIFSLKRWFTKIYIPIKISLWNIGQKMSIFLKEKS